ncbi:RNA 2',3'-cyclic phosphodiesterase [Trinickia mobilis]|uniref:RNA 2',3'-cyclic phosphodiesterase n=1 Tax=Trinickia mobilis TaxID=2816356 RepID=UPI002867E3A5|nr:RNA 2',3'-cyclic phosphodiesterase [Trinickia mobilis]
MDDEWQRCFIALAPDTGTREMLSALPSPPVARRVPVDQLHLTVAFLGTISACKGGLLGYALPSVAEALPVFRTERIEHWPGPAHPRLTVAVLAKSDKLFALAARLRALLEELDLPMDDRAFRPHITLARFPRDASALCELPVPVAGLTIRFDTLALYSSTLARHGARYSELASAALPEDEEG